MEAARSESSRRRAGSFSWMFRRMARRLLSCTLKGGRSPGSESSRRSRETPIAPLEEPFRRGITPTRLPECRHRTSGEPQRLLKPVSADVSLPPEIPGNARSTQVKACFAGSSPAASKTLRVSSGSIIGEKSAAKYLSQNAGAPVNMLVGFPNKNPHRPLFVAHLQNQSSPRRTADPKRSLWE